MSKDILGSLVRALVTVPNSRLGLLLDHANKLGGADGDTWEQASTLFLRKEPCWTNGDVAQAPEPKPAPSILELVSTVGVAATASKFNIKGKLVVDTSLDAKVKISYLGDNLQNWYFSGDGLVEEPLAGSTLRYGKLRKRSLDSPIILEIGGVEKSITSFTEAFYLMEGQPNGPKSDPGPLLTNGWANIFYIPQKVKKLKGNRFSYVNLTGKEVEEEVKDSQYLFQVGGQWYVLRAVRVDWYVGGWDVHAYSVERPFDWREGIQVFSRNSVIESSETLAPAQA